ncbi:MAG: cytochrome-c peroxidase [Bryobacteraceae bacterium]|nr:cytochrome-c peroxidase [Bryobacteraceae bacterium]MDW8379896.1 cytochrome-c peroxidase [Bryobacterales bacterium]
MQYFLGLVLALLTLLAGCGARSVDLASTEIDPELLANFSPTPSVLSSEKNSVSEAKVTLGRMLYYDPRLSLDNDVSCNSCHQLDRYGVDGKPVSTGHKGQKGSRNAPTVFHAAGHMLQFWDGRAADVEEQAKGPILNPVEMAMPSAAELERRLRAVPEYRKLFQAAFPKEKEPVTFENVALAIAAFERKLVTSSRWDKFLAGDKDALTPEEKQGFLAFYRAGCHVCHNGPQVGGRVFQKLGLVKPWPNQSDPGRFAVTKQDHDRMVFKAPSLRNVEKTAPYFHDGSVADLETAVRLMGEHQVEKPLTDRQAKAIVAWLRTLTGDLPWDYIKPPNLPRS